MLAHTDYIISLSCTNKTSQTEFNQTNRGTTPWAALRKLQRAVALYIYIAEAKQKFRIKLKWYFTPTIKKKKGQRSSLAKLAEANDRQL